MDITTGWILGGIVVAAAGIITFAVRRSNRRYKEEMKRIQAAKDLQAAINQENKRNRDLQRERDRVASVRVSNRSSFDTIREINQHNNEVRNIRMHRGPQGPVGLKGDTQPEYGIPRKERRMRDTRVHTERRKNLQDTPTYQEDGLDPVLAAIIYNNITSTIHTSEPEAKFEGRGGGFDGGGASGNWDSKPDPEPLRAADVTPTYYSAPERSAPEPAAYSPPERSDPSPTTTYSAPDTDSGSSSGSSGGSDGGGGTD